MQNQHIKFKYKTADTLLSASAVSVIKTYVPLIFILP